MRFSGGKSRIGTKIATIINRYAKNYEYYVEPFVGSAGVLQHINHPQKIASDANKAIITMWQAAEKGWEPPNYLSETIYQEIKHNQNLDDPLTAFVGFGCSYAGKWFGGFARDRENKNYCQGSKIALLKKIQKVQGTQWIHSSYENLKIPSNSLVYCDPPYENTLNAYGTLPINYEHFYQWCQEQVNNGNCVILSSFEAPPPFKLLWLLERKINTDRVNKKTKFEKLFILQPETKETT